MYVLLIVGLVGAFATFVDAIVGMGFGMLSTSLLMTVGIYPALASASIHLAKILTGFLSGSSHLWFGNVKREWLTPLAIPGAIGGAAGAYLLTSLPGKAMRPYIAGILLLLGIVVLHRFMPRRILPLMPAEATDPVLSSTAIRLATIADSPHKLPILGFVAAFVDAIGGGGWGSIVTPGLIFTGHAEPHEVIGTVNLAEVFTAVAISATFIISLGLSSLPWDLIATLVIGGIISAPIGAFLCRRLPARLLGIVTALALIALNLGIILETQR